MPREKKARICKLCGEPETADRPFSNRPNHLDCGINKAIRGIRGMARGEGPEYEQWAYGMSKAAQKALDRVKSPNT